jgi:hypothetical protein
MGWENICAIVLFRISLRNSPGPHKTKRLTRLKLDAGGDYGTTIFNGRERKDLKLVRLNDPT